MSRACGNAGRNARIAASESEQFMITDSPWVSAFVTPGSAASAGQVGAGRVARIVRSPTVALISVAGPSATTRPCDMRMIRSA